MAARTRRTTVNDKTREKIRTTQLIKRLVQHVNGEIELSATQVTAALGLMKKVLPDLQSVEMDQTVEVKQSVINAEPMSADEWASRYEDSVVSPGGATKSTH